MKDKKIENPLAFPKSTTSLSGGNMELRAKEYGGMTLRDYFAGQAMSKHASDKPKSIYQWWRWFFGLSYKSGMMSETDNARNAYLHADAMLKERVK